MKTKQLRLARLCTTNHHASKRRAAVWSALLSVLILTAAVVAPRVDAAPPGASPRDRCVALGIAVYRAYREAGASEETADAESTKAVQRCLQGIAKKSRKPKL
jgi:hypothetical protein